MEEFWDWNQGAHFGVFGFIIIIVLINAIAGIFRTRAKQDVLREAMRSGQNVDPDLIKSMKDEDDEGSNTTAGLVLMAVAVGLVFMGYQIEKVSEDGEVFQIMLGVSSIPFLIGVVLFLSGLFSKRK